MHRCKTVKLLSDLRQRAMEQVRDYRLLSMQ